MENFGNENPADKLVLIVDDDKGIRELLEIIVKKEGFKTELAEDGEEGLEKARSLSPDIILLDLMLPRSGGYEIVRGLQNEGTAAIPIIIISARNMDRSTKEMITNEPNVRDFIEKPLKTHMLTARLHQLMKTRPAGKQSDK